MNVPLPPTTQQLRHQWDDIAHHGSACYICDVCGDSASEVGRHSVCEGPERKRRRQAENELYGKNARIASSLKEAVSLCRELGKDPRAELDRVLAEPPAKDIAADPDDGVFYDRY